MYFFFVDFILNLTKIIDILIRNVAQHQYENYKNMVFTFNALHFCQHTTFFTEVNQPQNANEQILANNTKENKLVYLCYCS